MDPIIEKQLGEWRLAEMRRRRAVEAAAGRQGKAHRPHARWRRAAGSALMSAGWRLAGGDGVRVDMGRHTILPED